MKKRNLIKQRVTVSIVLLLLAVMLISPSVVYADSTGAQGTLIVENVEGNQTRFTACQIFRAQINEDGTASDFEWVSATVKSKVLQILNSSKYGAGLTADAAQSGNPLRDRAQKAAKWLSDYYGESSSDPSRRLEAEELLKEIADALDDEQIAAADVNRQTFDAGQAVQLDTGYWLIFTDPSSIEELNEAGTSPIFTLTDLGDGEVVRIKEKTALPTLKKEVKNDSGDEWGKAADAQFGQEIEYRLTGTLPDNYISFKEYTYRFHDVFAAGLDYVDGSVVVMIDGQDVTHEFDITWDNHTLEVGCSNLKQINGAEFRAPLVSADSVITVSYKAKLNAQAQTGAEQGNPNTASLIYSSDPQHSSSGDMSTNTTTEEDAVLYTFCLHVAKKDRDTNVPLPGAKFMIRQADGDEGTSYYLKKDSDSEYYSLTDDQNQASVFETAADGTVDLYGLDAGRYTLIEMQAPEGYDFRNAETSFSISADYEGTALTAIQTEGVFGNADAVLGIDETDDNTVNAEEASRVDVNTGMVNLTIGNIEKIKMPISGQRGITLFLACGMTLTAVSAALWMRRKNDKRTSDEA